jgi:hypothetical protein
VLLASIIEYQYLSVGNMEMEKDSSTMSTGKNTQKIYEHTFPEQVTKSDYFQ